MDRTLDVEAEVAATGSICDGCGRIPRQGWAFAFKLMATPASHGAHIQVGEITKCVMCAIRHLPMLKRSLTVAAVVGTILTILNHGDTLLIGEWNDALYWKIPLTYCVPFFVATFGALTNGRR